MPASMALVDDLALSGAATQRVLEDLDARDEFIDVLIETVARVSPVPRAHG